jgi:transposase
MKTQELRETFKLLDLSLKEAKVFLCLRNGSQTVLDIAVHTKVSRPSVYDILQKLKKRGLAQSHIMHGKKSWTLASEKELADTLYETKKMILGFVDGKDEIGGVTDGVVTVHRGKEAVKQALMGMITHRKNERFLCYTAFSDLIDKGWLTVLTPEDINEWNRMVKKNGIISELVAENDWIEKHYNVMGDTWAKDYEGRSSSAVYLPEKYFQHSGQIFAFKDVMYLLALNDKMIIEIRHSDIQKMVLAMYAFMKERGETVDVNKRLRELMGEE